MKNCSSCGENKTLQEFNVRKASKEWMNWDNYGLYNGDYKHGWDLDHIIPLSSALTIEDIIKLNHFSNLQPLCSKINRNIKKNNIEYENKA